MKVKKYDKPGQPKKAENLKAVKVNLTLYPETKRKLMGVHPCISKAIRIVTDSYLTK